MTCWLHQPSRSENSNPCYKKLASRPISGPTIRNSYAITSTSAISIDSIPPTKVMSAPLMKNGAASTSPEARCRQAGKAIAIYYGRIIDHPVATQGSDREPIAQSNSENRIYYSDPVGDDHSTRLPVKSAKCCFTAQYSGTGGIVFETRLRNIIILNGANKRVEISRNAFGQSVRMGAGSRY